MLVHHALLLTDGSVGDQLVAGLLDGGPDGRVLRRPLAGDLHRAAGQLDLDVDDSIDRSELKAHIESSLAEGTGVLWMADRRGREVVVPSDKVAYVEIGSPHEGRTIGFTS